MGMIERDGFIRTQIVPNAQYETFKPIVKANIERGSVVSTDEAYGYNLLEKEGYRHGAVIHSKKRWAWYNDRYDANHHTNTCEGYWSLFQRSVKSTHIHISRKYLDRYLGEFAMRSNHREMGNAMFDLLISAV
jgi:hypothetical protein